MNLRKFIDKQTRRGWAFWFRLTRASVIHCIGDSHSAVFAYINERHYLWHTLLKFCVVNGATATGIANPESNTQARPTFDKYIATIPPQDYILFCLGEVDCGFVIWYRSQKYGIPVREQLEKSIQTYCEFITDVKSKGHPNLIITSVPLPSVKDGQDWGVVAELRREVQATQAERTALTLEFNNHLREFARANHMLFLDLDQFLLDPKTGLLNDRFLNSNPLDHHLEPAVIAPYVVRLLRLGGFP